MVSEYHRVGRESSSVNSALKPGEKAGEVINFERKATFFINVSVNVTDMPLAETPFTFGL